MASPTVAAALDQLPNVNSLDQFRSLVNSLDVSAKPGPYILYSGSFPELPDALGNPTGAGAIANNLAQQIGASTIDQTPRAQFLADPATAARFQQLASDAGLDPKTAYSQQFFSNDNAFWRDASRQFVASTDGEGFAITGSQTRPNSIMVTDEIPTALANPNSQFTPANQPNVAAALSSGDEAQVRAALAQSTQNALAAGDIVRDPSGTFAISQEGLNKIGVSSPAPLPSAADLAASGFEQVAPVNTSATPSTVAAAPSTDELPPTAHSAGEPVLGSPTGDGQPPSTHIQTLPDNAPSIVPEMPQTGLTPTSPAEAGTPTASGTSSEAIPPSNPSGVVPDTSAAPTNNQVAGAPDVAAPTGNSVALAPEAPAPAPGTTATAAPEAPPASAPATETAQGPMSQPAILPDNAPAGSPETPSAGATPTAPDVAPSPTLASPAPEASSPAPGTTAAPEAPSVSMPTTGPAQSPVSQAPSIAPDNAPVGTPPESPSVSAAPTAPDLAPSGTLASPALEAPGSISGSATGRFLPGFAATIAESPTATTILRGAGALGALGAAADAGITGYNAYQLYNQGDTVGAGREVTGFGGRLGGALSGAWALGELGAVGGPWGALGGALVGGVTGAVLGDKAVKGIYDYLTGYQPPQSSNTTQPTPGWPDQFAAQFDASNGGGPYSDPATGMQLETQAQYDARKQAYVDQQMTNQQAQAQQFLDTLSPFGSNDTNAGNGTGNGAGTQGPASPSAAPGDSGASSNANQTNSDQTNIAPDQGIGQPDSTQNASPATSAPSGQANQTGPTLAPDALAPDASTSATQPGSGASDATLPSDTASASPSSIPSLASAPAPDTSTSTTSAPTTSGPSADNSPSIGAPASNPTPGLGAPDLTAATPAPAPTPDASPPVPTPAPAPNIASPSPASVAAPTPAPDVTPPVPMPAPAPVPDIASPAPAPAPAPMPPTPPAAPDISAIPPITPDLLSPTSLSLTPAPLTPPSLSDPSSSLDPLAPTSSIDAGLNTPTSSLDTGSSLGNSLTLSPGGDSNLTLTPSSDSGLSLDSGSSLSSGLDSTSSLGSSGFDAGASFSDGGGGDAGPVVLDLSGQGVRLTDMRTSSATFDVNGNGVQDQIAWTTPGEGILVYDPSGSSTVNNINQIELSRWSPGAKTDLQGLAAFDANHDGQLDAGDPAFSQFRIWTDSNGSGTGHLDTLVEAGVKSISLASDGVRTNLPDGSIIYGQGTFTRTDGTTGKLGDVALAYSPDISAARDQLAGALASAPAQPASNATAPPPPPSAPPPMLAADPHHAVPGAMR